MVGMSVDAAFLKKTRGPYKHLICGGKICGNLRVIYSINIKNCSLSIMLSATD